VTRYLLDSDAIIDYLKGVAATIGLLRQLGQQGHQLGTCDVVECEVYAGLPPAHRGRPSNCSMPSSTCPSRAAPPAKPVTGDGPTAHRACSWRRRTA
jgi:hypothetical protein